MRMRYLADIPQEILGYQVMAAVRIPPREGEVESQFVVICDCAESYYQNRSFIVWDVVESLNKYRAFKGSYDLTWESAWKELNRRFDLYMSDRFWYPKETEE